MSIVQRSGVRQLVRHHLVAAAGLLIALSLALVLRHNQAYVPVYQTFPVADWLEFTFGPDDAARFGSAETAVLKAIPLLESFQLGVAEYRLPVGFSEPHLRRQVAGLASSYSLSFARPAGPGDSHIPGLSHLSGRLELRVFRNASRARTYLGLHTMHLTSTKQVAEVTPLHPDGGQRVWLNVPAAQTAGDVEVRVLGQVGPAHYDVLVMASREATDWPGSRADLVARAQAFAETLALQWRGLLLEAWRS